jgi:hypothetical protein
MWLWHFYNYKLLTSLEMRISLISQNLHYFLEEKCKRFSALGISEGDSKLVIHFERKFLHSPKRNFHCSQSFDILQEQFFYFAKFCTVAKYIFKERILCHNTPCFCKKSLKK